MAVEQLGAGQGASRATAGSAAEAVSPAALASSDSSRAFRLVGGVECHGRPVEAMSFAVELPPMLQAKLIPAAVAAVAAEPGQPGQQGVSCSVQGAQVVAEAVRVEVCGRDVFLGAPGCLELRVLLPFVANVQVSLGLGCCLLWPMYR